MKINFIEDNINYKKLKKVKLNKNYEIKFLNC